METNNRITAYFLSKTVQTTRHEKIFKVLKEIKAYQSKTLYLEKIILQKICHQRSAPQIYSAITLFKDVNNSISLPTSFSRMALPY